MIAQFYRFEKNSINVQMKKRGSLNTWIHITTSLEKFFSLFPLSPPTFYLFSYQIDRAKEVLLQRANIICSTLGSVGLLDGLLESPQPLQFSHIIIDEACQAVEPACLVPLKFPFRRCVLVGLISFWLFAQE